jgi:hypothetical protein
VNFKLVRVDAKGAWFDGLSLLRDGADGMLAVVRLKNKDGSLRELSFRYKRVQ